MRILILKDKTLPITKPDLALERIKEDYKDVCDVSWTYEDRDFSNLAWENYLPNDLGIAWATVRRDMAEIYARDREKWDNVIYFVSEENWKAPTVGGWNLGSPINGYQVEIVRMGSPENDYGRYITFAMEIAHSWDNLTVQEIGDNLLSTFDVYDFDNLVIHGLDKRYGKLQHDGTYFTDYNYRPMIAMVKEKLKQAYAIRKKRYESPQFIFTRDLFLGSRGTDVSELQRRMKAEGLAGYEPTGYFGRLTLASVRAYQRKHGITPALGYCGLKTRTRLNTTPSSLPLPMGMDGHHDA